MHNSFLRRLLSVLIALALLISVSAIGREAKPPLSTQRSVQFISTVSQMVLPPVDVAVELAADAAVPPGTAPLRFAVPSEVAVSPATHGTWEQLSDGRLWRMRFISPGATDLNFGFSTFWLPEGATLHVSSETEEYYQGPYVAKDNKAHGQLWTAVVPGDSAVVEVFVPAGATEEPELLLSRVSRGYRDMFRRRTGVPKAGSCNIDVICPQGDPWRNEIRSVAVYSVGGFFLCTGSLVMNTARDFRNYFLTANHCEVDAGAAPSMVVYWNFQSPSCGLLSGGSLAQNQSGAIFRASKFDVDVTLLELEDIPDPSFNVYYSGWDRTGVAPPGAVGIHHPNTDEKAISFSTTTLQSVSSCIGTGGSGTHWRVFWSSGVTEPGSSGSGIWHPTTHLLVGTLSGGGSSCGSPGLSDCYGKFSVAWNSGATPDSRLRDWLDPLNTGVTTLPGSNPSPVVGDGAVLASEMCLPANGTLDSGEVVTMNFFLKNFHGTNSITNLVATLEATNGVVLPSGPQAYPTLVPGGPAQSKPFTFMVNAPCGESVTVYLRLQAGTNDLGRVSFVLPLPGTLQPPFFSQAFDLVSAPGLPPGWSSSANGAQVPWTTASTFVHTAPNAAFAPNAFDVGNSFLVSPNIAIPAGRVQLTFRHMYALEAGYDGGVLELKIGGGSFNDIIAAGGHFITGGYGFTIPIGFGNPIGGRPAWTGDSGGFVTTTVNLPNTTAGQNVQLRWRCATDETFGDFGWFVDTITLSELKCCVSSPVIFGAARSGTNFVFSFATLSGNNYFVEYKTNLLDLSWTALQTVPGNGAIHTITNTGVQGGRFYRIRMQ